MANDGLLDILHDGVIHEYNNDSGQGEAMGELFAVARKIIGMTATLINGYSSGIFHLLYRTVPHLMQKDSKPYTEPEQFNSEYGVVQSVFEERVVEYASKRRTQRRKIQTKQLPGVSPLVYSRFLLEQAAFLRLTDMGKDLPEYEEIPIPVSMPEDVEAEYKRLEKTFVNILRRDPKIKRKIMSGSINLLTVYPDQPYGQEPILHPADRQPLVEPAELGAFDTLGPKEQAVFDLAQKAIGNGEKVLVYTSWVRVDSQQKLQKLFNENGYRTAILPATVKPDAREEWVKQLKQYRRREPVHKGHGDIICCLDESGSTRGDPAAWGKAVALALLDIAAGNGRKFALIHFASYDSCRVDVFLPGQYTMEDKMNAAEVFLGGGTNFERPMQEAIGLMENEGFENADIVFITDGECALSEEYLEALHRDQAERKFKVTGVLLDTKEVVSGFSLEPFCQQIYRTSQFVEEDIVQNIISQRI